MSEWFSIGFRRRVEVNTDPLRRCYNGTHARSEIHWTDWSYFGKYTREGAQNSVNCFAAINPTHEYKIVPYDKDLY